MNTILKAQKAVEILEDLSAEDLNEYLLGQITRTIKSLKTDVINEEVYVVNRETLNPKDKFTLKNAVVLSIKSDGANFSGRHVSWQKVLVEDPQYGKVLFNTSQDWVYSASVGDTITGTLRVKLVKDGLVIAQCKHRDMVLEHDSGKGVIFEACAS